MAARLGTPIGRINASRVHLDRFVERAAASVSPGALVLDAGAGSAPYRHRFAHTRYETADFKQVDKTYAPDVTYVGDLAAIPVEDHRFDLVIMTQVLEHLPEPITVLREMHRVLTPGARIWASCPLYYEEHEQPYDFYRYTQFALRRMFAEAGCHDAQIDWLEGYLGTVGYQLDVAAQALPRLLLPVRAMLIGVSEICNRSDVRRKRTDRGHPKNYTVVATG
jgi:SAM-dependent methyltransferase